MNSCKNEHKELDNEVVAPVVQNDSIVEKEKIENDAVFIAYATELNLFEIEVGRLALQKATNGDVKEYARMLIDDHNKSLEELKTLANKKSFTIPNTIPETLRVEYNLLNGKATGDFDNEFINMMVDGHEKAADKMTEISQKIKDNDFRLWASRQIDSFIKHRDEAKKLKEKFGGN